MTIATRNDRQDPTKTPIPESRQALSRDSNLPMIQKRPITSGEVNFAQYVNRLEEKNVTPLWTMMEKMVPPHPNPKATTTSWECSLMRPALLEASEIVSATEAERRVLVLVNQSMSAPNTTDTICAGLQIVLPDETAPAHRHRAFVLRFIIEGSEGFTAVEGEKIKMSKGDVVLTPSWHWHDHGNEGSDPVIWLDDLDLPLWQFLPINMLQQYAEPRYPSTKCVDSDIRISWDTVARELDAARLPHAIYHYKRSDGSDLSRTISAQAERISPGHTTDVKQAFFFAPNDTIAKRVEWASRDTFAVPAHSKVSHTCSSTEEASYLFAVNDIPLIKALTFVNPPSSG
ncbi:gentisate 1,2-dioxygenase [Stemphylium lycopersici]|nr:gentisate 1,2-dioxygenase [Stemphylium lycopersici]